MKFITFFFTFLLLTFCSHLPADLDCFTCRTPVCWRGIYLSGQFGELWGRAHPEYRNNNYFNTLGAKTLGSRFHFRSKGSFGGGALGYNFQIQGLVFGAEGGAYKTHLTDSRISPFFPAEDINFLKQQWLAFAKLRLGYSFHRLLTFISGGWAGGDVDINITDTRAHISANSKKWANGWTIGIGADYKLWRFFSLGLSYDYYQLSHDGIKTSCPLCGTGTGHGTPILENRLQTQALTVRVNYIFNL